MDRIVALLLDWYDAHARTLPWRGIDNPYATWVSETMLQQTRVETVKGYYQRFLTAFPTIEALAEAQEEEVLKLWEGLGYYSRARNLHAGAKQVVTQFGGKLPSDVNALRTIRGIGPYTAGAIASIAFRQPVPAVDGNVIRVTARLFDVRENVGIPSVKRQIETYAEHLIPSQRPGDFNQALMDLGSSICVPGTPNCESCPLASCCHALEAGDPESIPLLPRKNPPKTIHYALCLIHNENNILMRCRTEALLHGLWVFPLLETDAVPTPTQIKKKTGLSVASIRPAGEARHVFTHQIWQMKLYTMMTTDHQPKMPYHFVSTEEMQALPLPTAVRAAKELILQSQ